MTRVLIIEDNAQNMYLVTFLLRACGFTCTEAYDGRAGIDAALAVAPDLILLDIQLPVMDGYAVARELRRHAHLAGIPIIGVTSFAMAGDREKVLAAGCDGYIEKPIDPDTFISQISAFLPEESGS